MWAMHGTMQGKIAAEWFLDGRCGKGAAKYIIPSSWRWWRRCVENRDGSLYWSLGQEAGGWSRLGVRGVSPAFGMRRPLGFADHRGLAAQ